MSKPWEADVKSDPDASDKEVGKMSSGSEKDPLIKNRKAGSQASIPCDFFGFQGWYRHLQQTFGMKLLLLLWTVNHILKGFVGMFMGRAVPYMFKAYGVPAPQVQVYSGVISLPWAMKPIIGMISDILPIAGYNKAPYMTLTCVLGAVAYAFLGCTDSDMLPIGVAVMCLFCCVLQMSTCDLLVEAKYSEKIKLHPSEGPSLVTYVWLGMSAAGLVAVALSGVALDYLGYSWVLLLCMVPASAPLVPVLAGFMGEPCLTDEMKAEKRARFFAEPEMAFLCIVMFSGTVTMTVAGMIWHDPLVSSVLAGTVAFIVLASFSLLLSPVIAKFNAFSLIQSCCCLSTGGASFYFFTDTAEQYPANEGSPGGPHFSKFFYNSVLGIVGSLCSILGIWTYKRYLSTWRYRSLLIFTNVTLCVLNGLELLLYTRVNLRLGIPDQAFMISASVMEHIIMAWQWMPQVVIYSYMVPEGLEATMYALLAGCHNLGGAVSANCGALLLQQLGVRPSGAVGETDMFDNLWVASAISTCMPLLCICTLYWLIPNVSQTEPSFLDCSNESASTGSVWRKWRQVESIDEEISH